MKKLLLLFAAALAVSCSEQQERVAVASVSLSDDAVTLSIGDTKQLTATVLPADAEIRILGWSASGDAAQVDQNGLVTAIKAGSSIVTVTSVDGKKTDTATITVRPDAEQPEPSPIEEGYFSVDEAVYHETEIPAKTTETALSGASVTNGEAGRTIALGSEVALDKILVGVKGTAGYLELDAAKYLVTRAAFNYSVALTPAETAAEEFTLIVSATTADGDVMPSKEVSVGASDEAVAVSEVVLEQPALSLKAATAQTLTWEVLPAEATNKAVTFSSSAPDVATVDAVGKVTALKAGQAVITIASAADPTKMDTCNLTVTPADEQVVSDVLTKITDEKFLAFAEGKMTDWDADEDEKLQPTEAAAVKELGIPELGIESLAGIEYFTGLERLIAHQNQLTTVDVSHNPALIQLLVESNKITSINISGNPALEHLGAGDNQLATVDVSASPLLVQLDMQKNKLSAIDVSRNPALAVLYASDNQLKTIDLSDNKKLQNLSLDGNLLPNLDIKANTELAVLSIENNPGDGVAKFPVLAWFDNDAIPGAFPTAKWTYGGVEITPDYGVKPLDVLDEIPDADFKAYAAEKFAGDDGVLTEAEAAAVTTIDIPVGKHVASLAGIEYFTTITTLHCLENDLTTVDLSANTALTQLYLNGNEIAALDVSKNTALEELSVTSNPLTALDLSKNTALTQIIAPACELTALDLSANTELVNIDVAENKLTSLSLPGGSKLMALKCSDNQLTELDLSSNTSLRTLEASSNALEALDISANTALNTMLCDLNPGDGESKFPVTAWFDNDNVPSGVSPNTSNYNFTTGSWTSGGKTIAVEYIDPNASDPEPEANVLDEITDAAFKAYAEQFAGDDGVLTEAEAAAVTTMDIPGDAGIASMAGLENFTGLTMLRCNNFDLTSLDVSALTELTELHCDFNNLTSLDVSNNTKLEVLGIGMNKFSSIDLSANTDLVTFMAPMGKLTSLDVSGNTKLSVLNVEDNELTSIDVSGLSELTELHIGRNGTFGSIDVSGNPALTHLGVAELGLTALNISANTALNSLMCDGNPGDGVNTFPITSWFDITDIPENGSFTTAPWTIGEGDAAVEITPVYSK